MSAPPPARSTSARTPAAAGPASLPGWMAPPSSRSSPIPPGAATTPMPSPRTASSTWPTRSARPSNATPTVGQHHRRPQDPGLFHLRPELQPGDRPQHHAVRPGHGLQLDRGQLELRHPQQSRQPQPGLPPGPVCRRQLRRLHVHRPGPELGPLPQHDLRRRGRGRQPAARERHQPEPLAGQHRLRHRDARPRRPVQPRGPDGHPGPRPAAGRHLRRGRLRHQPGADDPRRHGADRLGRYSAGPRPTAPRSSRPPRPPSTGSASSPASATPPGSRSSTRRPGDSTFGQVIGGFNPSTITLGQAITANASNSTDAFGNFAIPVGTRSRANGLKTIEVYATDDAGCQERPRDALVHAQRQQHLAPRRRSAPAAPTLELTPTTPPYAVIGGMPVTNNTSPMLDGHGGRRDVHHGHRDLDQSRPRAPRRRPSPSPCRPRTSPPPASPRRSASRSRTSRTRRATPSPTGSSRSPPRRPMTAPYDTLGAVAPQQRRHLPDRQHDAGLGQRPPPRLDRRHRIARRRRNRQPHAGVHRHHDARLHRRAVRQRANRRPGHGGRRVHQ